MAMWAKFGDGVEVDDRLFGVLAKFAPDGTLDVFASDQHNSYLKLLESFFAQIKLNRRPTDEDVTEVCTRFASHVGGVHSAALFNHLAYEASGFRDRLGKSVMLIGRLEDTNTVPIDGGKGQLAQLAREPEKIADKVDGYKTLVKLDPDHPESWKRNQEWLHDVFERCNRLGKPLFNETLIFERKGESKAEMAARLPEAVVRMAEDFSPFGHIYKTQAPVLWAEDKVKTKDAEGKEKETTVLKRVSSPDVIRRAALDMHKVVKRPMLLLSAAVDFDQYAAQYGIVCDVIAGPMCGRAYFKEAFKDKKYDGYYEKNGAIPWDLLEEKFVQVAIPRMQLIRDLARNASEAWWAKFTWMADQAKSQIKDTKPRASGVSADYGY